MARVEVIDRLPPADVGLPREPHSAVVLDSRARVVVFAAILLAVLLAALDQTVVGDSPPQDRHRLAGF